MTLFPQCRVTKTSLKTVVRELGMPIKFMTYEEKTVTILFCFFIGSVKDLRDEWILEERTR